MIDRDLFPTPTDLEKFSEYISYIESILSTRENVWREYSECHHIVPRCLDGTDCTENLIYLTSREHFIAHQLLALSFREVPGLVYAAYVMSKRGEISTPDEYSEMRKVFVDSQRKIAAKVNSSWIHVHQGDIERYVKRSEIEEYLSRGYSIGMSLPHRERLGDSRRGSSRSEETKARMRESALSKNKGKIWINNGESQKTIYLEELSDYPGYVIGRLPFNPTHIQRLKDIERTTTHRENLSHSLKSHFRDNPDARKNISDRQKSLWSDPDYREKMSKRRKEFSIMKKCICCGSEYVAHSNRSKYCQRCKGS